MDRKFYRDYFLVIIIVTGIMVASIMLMDKMIISTDSTTHSRRCFIIDAGHGGEDGGAVSVTGVLESEINLQIASKTSAILSLVGYKSLMLRADENDLHTQGSTIAQRKQSDLKNRVSVINSTPNAVLISIHQNYFSDHRYSGMQVFYANTLQSKELAGLIQSEYKRLLLPESRRVIQKIKNVYLFDHIQCPGVLVECGFISNYAEEAMLCSDEYQLKLSLVILNAVIKSTIH